MWIKEKSIISLLYHLDQEDKEEVYEKLEEQKRTNKTNGVTPMKKINPPLENNLENINKIENNSPIDLVLPDNDDNENNNNSYFWPATKFTLGVSCVVLAALLTAKFFSSTS